MLFYMLTINFLRRSIKMVADILWHIFKAYPVSLLRGSIKGGFGKPLVSQDSRAKLLDTPPIWSEAE